MYELKINMADGRDDYKIKESKKDDVNKILEKIYGNESFIDIKKNGGALIINKDYIMSIEVTEDVD